MKFSKIKLQTEKIKNASNLLNVQFLDHIIIGENSFISCMTTN